MIKEVRRGNNLERVGGGGMVSSEEISFIGIQYSTGGVGGGDGGGMAGIVGVVR